MRLRSREPIAQEHAMGCGLACVAFLTGHSYRYIHRRCHISDHAWGRGFYCTELVDELGKYDLNYQWRPIVGRDRKNIISLAPNGSVLFIDKGSSQFPQGHFFVKVAAKLFMNPWKTFPSIANVQAGFQQQLPGRVSFVIEPCQIDF